MPTNTDTTSRQATLRRIAIVLSSLPAPVAAKLMGTIDGDSKQSIRRAMASLADVDPLERKWALQAFKLSVQSEPPNSADPNLPSQHDPSGPVGDDSVHLGRTQVPRSPGMTTEVLKRGLRGESETSSPVSSNPIPQDPASASPLAFLGDIQDDTLVGLMGGEHPQAVALVLASIAPAQAARILPRLDSSLRSAALSRVGRLAEIPEAAANDVADHFRQRLQNEFATRPNTSSGKRTLDAILAAMSQPEPQSSISPQNDPSQAIAPEQEDASLDSPTESLDHRLRVAPGTDRREDIEVVDPSDSSDDPSESQLPPALRSIEAIDQHLNQISPASLCNALGCVDTRCAMLALCGLPKPKVESVLAILPRDQAKQVRSRMNSLASLRLRDIDVAKERVVLASLESQSHVRPVAAAA